MTEKDRTPVAQPIITKCTKCKMETGHVVISLNREGIVAKVKCNACGNEHRYYSDKKRLSAKKNREKAAQAAAKIKTKQEYEQLISQKKTNRIINYTMGKKYHAEDIIEHKTFGKGAVVKVFPEKMDVLFESGHRMLACNRS